MAFKGDESVRRLLASTAADEPIFILVGRDVLADELVDAWAYSAEVLKVPAEKVREARDCADAMREYTPRKAPD